MDKEISVRDLIKRDFGIDLPISGGNGNSLGNAVVIDGANAADFNAIEYRYLRSIGIGRGVNWEFLSSESLEKEGRKFDKLKIRTVEMTDDEIVTQTENYYFDITSCLRKDSFVAPDGSVQLFNIVFPRTICGLLRCEVRNHEFTSPGNGYSIPYNSPKHGPQHVCATIYIYDSDLPDIPTDPTSEIVVDHFHQAITDVFKFGELQHFEVRLKNKYGRGYSELGVKFLCADFEIAQEGNPQDSFLFLGLHEGRFVKIRYTAEKSDKSFSNARDFSNSIAAILWQC